MLSPKTANVKIPLPSLSRRWRLPCLGALLSLALCQGAEPFPPETFPIIRRELEVLYEGTREFRFLGLAAPNLQANENQLRPDFSNRFPDEYEIRDLLGALQQTGARATRTFALSVFSAQDGGAPVYLQGHRDYNEEAFQCLDRVLALAPKYDVRILLPLIASQSFPSVRGVDEFAALAGKPGPLFWTDPGLKDDFRHLLSYLVNRRNTVSGLLYRDDPAILAWQLGNEFGSYAPDRGMNPSLWAPLILAWTREMAAFLKSIDPHHLVAEAGGCPRADLLADPHIDIISEHLYAYWNRLAGRSTDLAALARQARADCRGKKVLLIDEFGLGATPILLELMEAIRQEGISGGLLWSLRSHRRDGGWYYHNEGGTSVNSYHFPGFAVGFAYDETRLLSALRKRAFALQGKDLEPLAPPSPAPVLLLQEDGFTWRGSTGAASYRLERAPTPAGPWTEVAAGLADSVIADAARFEADPASAYPLVLWHDTAAEPGEEHYYRLRGENGSGASGWSPVVRVAYP